MTARADPNKVLKADPTGRPQEASRAKSECTRAITQVQLQAPCASRWPYTWLRVRIAWNSVENLPSTCPNLILAHSCVTCPLDSLRNLQGIPLRGPDLTNILLRVGTSTSLPVPTMRLQWHSSTKCIVSLYESASERRLCEVSGGHSDIFTLYIFDIFKKSTLSLKPMFNHLAMR